MFRLLMRACTPSASSSPTAFWMSVMATAMTTVLTAAPRPAGSVKISRKLARPTKCLTGLSPSQSVNAKAAPWALGTMTTNA